MSDQVARAACDSQHQRAGHALKSVGVVLNQDIVVVILHGALTPAERAISASATGALQVQEFHRILFASSSAELLLQIKEITGVEVIEAVIQVGTTSKANVASCGTMVQVFLLANALSTEAWNSVGSSV